MTEYYDRYRSVLGIRESFNWDDKDLAVRAPVAPPPQREGESPADFAARQRAAEVAAMREVRLQDFIPKGSYVLSAAVVVEQPFEGGEFVLAGAAGGPPLGELHLGLELAATDNRYLYARLDGEPKAGRATVVITYLMQHPDHATEVGYQEYPKMVEGIIVHSEEEERALGKAAPAHSPAHSTPVHPTHPKTQADAPTSPPAVPKAAQPSALANPNKSPPM